MYIGVLGVALAVAGLAWRLRERPHRATLLPLLASSIVGVWLSFGFRAAGAVVGPPSSTSRVRVDAGPGAVSVRLSS